MKPRSGFVLLLLGLAAAWAGCSKEPPPPPPAPPVIEEPEVVDEIMPPVFEPRKVGVTGRVVDHDLRPLLGAVVELDGEGTACGPDGNFAFPPEVRPRASMLTVRLDGREVTRWSRVVTGELELVETGARDPAALEVDRQPLPAAPERIHCNVNVDLRPRRPIPRLEAEAFVEPRDAIVELWTGETRARIRGRTNLPDGTHLLGSLTFAEIRVQSSANPASVQGGAFDLVLRGESLFAGEYGIEVGFNEVLELPSDVERWRREFPGFPATAAGSGKLFVGTIERSTQEDFAAQAYYRELVSTARVYYQALRVRVREIRRLGRGWDPELLSNMRAARLGWFHHDYIGENGEFREDRWRHFLDNEWRAGLDALQQRHDERGMQKYERAERMVYQLLSALKQMSYLYSVYVVYKQFGLPRHVNDYYLDEAELGDLARLQRIVTQSLDGLKTYCELVPDAKQ